ncbi:stAR-related lipid transfer protein 7, mitochondrial [Scyliorhinus canicula]|uniref:stAR-related lipid transfer protein 7, mitochondrial n=1 Tax=Scyliorhinus canicula TaxID=7830 RepID=UPI0018F30348|nr:stAR-related lipid transfer protein 7, mitochondrial [Scyliorhinus canicula]XP_038641498.1 stAR-related lipid transfer protein 7, mitochondrial [Scyliorhinus canicula]XP_038641499.1 stAR-related lipid transfer protein 7, mitochondrial [Scyliorhinus canicula]XP_038641500.1 stAR-related lipid transfer protein 7, mitochondrial [Scyliorhinus canicula]XP_038641501.1 stAR-related lipid transfer protein 7, mitochondrial [Scyliorhinus canicula]
MLSLRRPPAILNPARSKPLAGRSSPWLWPARSSSQAVSWGEAGWLAAWTRRALGLLRGGFGAADGTGGAARRKMVSILASQCSYVTGQRLRRAQQIGQLYSNLYSEHSRRSLFTNLWRRFQSRHSGSGKLVAAFAAVFMWDSERIRDEELQRCLSDFKSVEAPAPEKQRKRELAERVHRQEDDAWEPVMDRPSFRLWRRPIPGSHLYQYRVFGTYTDVTPRQFFNVQLDTEYRKKWDELVIKLEVIERDDLSGSEIVHWVTHFPYPLYSRDYLYIRRYHVDQNNNIMVLVSRAVEHPEVPESPSYVRVSTYQSQMVIKPHRSFDENGFDYLLTYSDDPQTVFPRYCVSWMMSSGMPDFLEKLHTAAVRARNMEIKIKDYISSRVSESVDAKQLQNPEHQGSSCGSHQMDYA